MPTNAQNTRGSDGVASHCLKDIDVDRLRRWSIAAAVEGVSRSRFIAAAADQRAQNVLADYTR